MLTTNAFANLATMEVLAMMVTIVFLIANVKRTVTEILSILLQMVSSAITTVEETIRTILYALG